MKIKGLQHSLTFFLLLTANYTLPCSMFKITLHGKTMVGNNEDAWRVNSRIWFETGNKGHFGAAYVGHDDGFPQGGLNEEGLAYDGFTVYSRTLKSMKGKMKIDNPATFLKSILQQCTTIQEVQSFVNRHDRSRFNGSMFLFVDKSGDYLVVEADTTLAGHEEKYVLSNFCPSVTPNPERVHIDRYKRGIAFLRNKADTSVQFCRSVMDTMHECRARLGDGTTYTSIYDLNAGLIYLYFYHDFQHEVSFDLKRELAKGDHILLMPSLFPQNAEYIRFTQYKTPFNSLGMKLVLVLAHLFVLISLPFFLFTFWREFQKGKKPTARPKTIYTWLLLFMINLGLVYYIYQLTSNKAIFYFSAPYKEEAHWLLNLSSFFPSALLLLFLPVGYLSLRAVRQSRWNKLYLSLCILNLTSYATLLALFGYWGLYVVG